MVVNYPQFKQISWSFSLNNVKVFFTLCLNVFTLLDSLTSSRRPFQIKPPKYEKHFWLRALVLSRWKSFKEEFLVTVLFCLVVVYILFIYFWEEFKNARRKTLFASLVYWKPNNLVKIFSPDVLSFVQL